MRSLLILALILFAATTQSIAAERAEVLVETLRKTAKPGDAITEEEQKIAKKVQAAGASAIPYLLPLLHDNDDEVRSLVSYTLQDMKGLTDEHLEVLTDSGMGSDYWMAQTIAKIGTPRAVTFLVEEVGRERPRTTDLALEDAMKIAGQKAVPELLKMASDETASPAKRARAITALGVIGPAAAGTAASLVALRKIEDEKILAAVDFALVNMRVKEAVPILLKRLEETGDGFSRRLAVRDVAKLSTGGKSAGPAVMKYLADDDWDVRVEAVYALGCIGYNEATGDLVKLLARAEDWRMVFATARSLQLLKAKEALPTLAQVSKAHWYPPVRAAAAQAIRTIRGNTIRKDDDAAPSPPPDFFDYEHAGMKMASISFEDAKTFRFPIVAHPNKLVTVLVEKRGEAARKEAWVGVEVEGGCVAGSDHGEWGGQIGFIDRTGKPQIFATENTQAIYKTEHGIFAITGLAHMLMNHGMIFKLSKGAEGAWTAEKWRALPGAPRFSHLLSDGRMFVSCSGGMVVVSPDGSMKSLTRGESLKSAARRR